MAGNYCPIFDRQDGRLLSIGLWAVDARALDRAVSKYESSRSVDVAMAEELLGLTEPTLRFLVEAKTRRVANVAVDVGNGVRFENGLFVMLLPYSAPNEELSANPASVKFVLQMQDGVPMLKRSGPRPSQSDPTPPLPPGVGAVSAPMALRPWWKFW